MRVVERDEIVDYQTYEEQRSELRSEVMRQKADRRIHVGEELTFLFETHETMRYQIQEMMRTEKIVREADIAHEIETYNEVLGGAGELGSTLLIEIDSQERRDVRLRELLDLPKHLYAKLADGDKVYASFDARQVGDDRVSSVQYLKFPVAGRAPVAIGADHPKLSEETLLSADQRAALEADLAS